MDIRSTLYAIVQEVLVLKGINDEVIYDAVEFNNLTDQLNELSNECKLLREANVSSITHLLDDARSCKRLTMEITNLMVQSCTPVVDSCIPGFPPQIPSYAEEISVFSKEVDKYLVQFRDSADYHFAPNQFQIKNMEIYKDELISQHSYRGRVPKESAEKTKELSRSTVQAVRISKIKLKSVVGFFGPNLGTKVHFHHDSHSGNEEIEEIDKSSNIQMQQQTLSSSLSSSITSPSKPRRPMSPSPKPKSPPPPPSSSSSLPRLLVPRSSGPKKNQEEEKKMKENDDKIDVLIKITNHWDPSEAEKLGHISEENHHYLRFLGYIVNNIEVKKSRVSEKGEEILVSIQPEYSLAFEYPKCGSLRETLLGMKTRGLLFGRIELHIKVFLVILYQVLDICEYLHEKHLKFNRLSLENLYISNFDYKDPENINIEVQFNDFHFLELKDSRVPDIDDCDGEIFRHYAPETLKDHNFSEKCNVWAFGVLAWELFSYGEVPYSLQEVENETQLLILLNSGFMLHRPTACPEMIYNTILRACWRKDKLSRPGFEWLKLKLDEKLTLLRFQANIVTEEMRQGGDRATMLKSPVKK